MRKARLRVDRPGPTKVQTFKDLSEGLKKQTRTVGGWEKEPESLNKFEISQKQVFLNLHKIVNSVHTYKQGIILGYEAF